MDQSLYTAEHTLKSKVPKMLKDQTLKQELKEKAGLDLISRIREPIFTGILINLTVNKTDIQGA